MSAHYVPGWEYKPAEVEIIRGKQIFPFFAMTPAAQLTTDIPDEVYLWKAYEKITGAKWPSRNQGAVGSCVSFGTAAAIEATMSVEVMLGEPEEILDLVQEVIYAGSRVEIGGGRINGDGSVGAWAADFVKRYGVLNRGQHGKYDLSNYSESLCRSWGKTGVPDDLEPEVKKYPVKGITQLTNWKSAKVALANGYGIAICSNQGFSMTRDADGFARPSGSWAHCMALLGYKIGTREGGFICNSWGPNAHSGPVGAGSPPLCGFWADAKTIDDMLSQDDSWAFSGFAGFPARKINWFI
jgi:hypothetical protein